MPTEIPGSMGRKYITKTGKKPRFVEEGTTLIDTSQKAARKFVYVNGEWKLVRSAIGPYSAIVKKEGTDVWAEDEYGKTIAEGEAGVDDASVIHSTVDAVYNSGGGKVFIKKGVYYLDSLIELKNKVSILSEYADLVCRVTQDSFTKGVLYNATERLENIEIARLRIWSVDKNTVCIRGAFRDSSFHDLVLNHQIILGHIDPDIISETVEIRNIEMLSGLNYDGSTWDTLPKGHDAGINIKGKNITVDTVWLKPKISSFEGGHVVNVKPFDTIYSTNIVMRNLYIEGAIPEVMHIYAYGTGEADVEPVFKVENVYYKMTSAPDYGRYATIAFEIVRADGLTAEIGQWTFENVTVDCTPTPHNFTTTETFDYDTPTRGYITFKNIRLKESKVLFVYGHADEIKFENVSVEYSSKFALGRIFAGRSGEHHIHIKNMKIKQATDSDPYIDGSPDSTAKIYNLYLDNIVITSANNRLSLINNGSQDIIIRKAERLEYTVSDLFKFLKNKGTATFSGDGSTTQFSIAHGLVSTPSKVLVTPMSADAAGDFYITVDDTYIYVNYKSAPPSGTDNVKLNWRAEV